MPAQAKSAVEIHSRIADGQPDDLIARAVGRKERVIRYHRAWRCQCAVARPDPVDRPAVAPAVASGPPVPPDPVDVGDPVAVATAAYLAGISPVAIATALGINAYDLDADVADFGLKGAAISRRRLERLAARSDALERMQRQRPAQWASWVADADAAERKEALDSRLPRETWTAFFAELVQHQSTILTERDMQDWIRWVKELAIYRYPTMAE